MRRVLALVWVVACNDSRGVVIEVSTAEAPSAYVELFLASTVCHDCGSGMAPKTFHTKQAGDIYYLDKPTMFALPVDGDVARFLIDPSDANEIPLLEAIGLDDAGNITGSVTLGDIQVPTSQVERWKLALEPIAPWLATPFDDTPGAKATLWRRPGDPKPGEAEYPSDRAACLGIEATNGSARFLVPDDDPDCDGVTGTEECEPMFFGFAAAPGLPACFQRTPACQLGKTSSCVDGLGGPGCFAEPYCYPDRACACETLSTTCVQALLSETTVTRVRCDIPSEFDNVNNTYKPCVSKSATLDLDAYFENGTTCTAAGFGPLLSPSLAPMPTIGYAMASGATTGNIQVGMPRSECQFDVSWSGNATANGTVNTQFQILTSTGKKLFMRMHLAWEDTCTRPMRCYLAPDTAPALSTDNIWACAR